ncbi:MAG: isoprenylcysteine carboxylmethyltransferase family protein, partial [Rhodomicrobium sp.]
ALGSAWRVLLGYDNVILGVVLIPVALNIWIQLYKGTMQVWPYISAGFYWKPIFSLLPAAFSAIYVTGTSLLLLTSGKPVARDEALLPNLLAVLGAFSAYLFGFLSPTETPLINIWVPLILLLLGAALGLLSLVYLQRSFSVTPQAHSLKQGGPYAFIRHPMYAGSILSAFGVGLLLGTPESLLLAFAIAGFQIGRAYFEERILLCAFPDYGAYVRKAGAFLPRLHLRRARVAP